MRYIVWFGAKSLSDRGFSGTGAMVDQAAVVDRRDSRVAVSRGAAAFGDVLRIGWNAWTGRLRP
jgi:hypothetical protein